MKLPWVIHQFFSPYRIRQRIVRKLIPANMTVFCFAGMEEIGGTNLFDPATMEGWLEVKLQFWDLGEAREENGIVIVPLYKQHQNEGVANHQSFDM